MSELDIRGKCDREHFERLMSHAGTLNLSPERLAKLLCLLSSRNKSSYSIQSERAALDAVQSSHHVQHLLSMHNGGIIRPNDSDLTSNAMPSFEEYWTSLVSRHVPAVHATAQHAMASRRENARHLARMAVQTQRLTLIKQRIAFGRAVSKRALRLWRAGFQREQRSAMARFLRLQRLRSIRDGTVQQAIATAISQTVVDEARLARPLHAHQREGVRWLMALHSLRLNGILADEMGLGKTVQAAACMALHRDCVGAERFLVVCPTSLLGHWQRELQAVAPAMRAAVYAGKRRDRRRVLRAAQFDVLIVGYEMAARDGPLLRRINWSSLTLDEAHCVKGGRSTQRWRVLSELGHPGIPKVLLTGTPVQNSVRELWSLLHFAMPTVFTSLEDLLVEDDDDEDVACEERCRLRQLLEPFVLRRLKQDVLVGVEALPPKHEQTVWLDLTAAQQAVYDKFILEHTMNKFDNVDMQLRKVCNDPQLLVGKPAMGYTEAMLAASAKMQYLDTLLAELRAGNHRVLVFSQMTRMLDLLGHFLQLRRYAFLRLDGQTPSEQRDQLVDTWQRENVFCFLLSTRAGGLGLNLQAADTVILFDSDWNPSMDEQAVARAHRLGQARPVRIVRLACHGTVEARMLRCADRKRRLQRQILSVKL